MKVIYIVLVLLFSCEKIDNAAKRVKSKIDNKIDNKIDSVEKKVENKSDKVVEKINRLFAKPNIG